MSVLGSAMMLGSSSVPFFNGLKLNLDSSDSNVITSAYRALTSTVTGTSGLSTLVCSGDESTTVFASMTIKVNSAEIYTVQSVATSVGVTTITVVGTLSASYTAKVLATLGVTAWNDKSALSYNGTSSGANEPTYSPSAQNSNAVLTFDGSNDFITIPSFFDSLGNGDFTIFTVAKGTSNTTQQDVLAFGNDGGNPGIVVLRINADTVQNRVKFKSYSGNLSNAVSKSSVTVGSYHIYNISRTGTTQSLIIDNGTATTNTNGVNGSGTGSQVGSGASGSVPLNGAIAHVIVFNRILTSTETLLMNRYLSQKWGITIS